MLGDILVKRGLLDTDQLQEAERHGKQTGRGLATSVVELGLVSESSMLQAMADQLGMPFSPVNPHDVDEMAAAMIPRSLAEQLAALPIAFGADDELIVAVANPGQLERVKSEITAETGLPIRVALGPRKAINQAITHFTSSLDEGTLAPLGSTSAASRTATNGDNSGADGLGANGSNGSKTNGFKTGEVGDEPSTLRLLESEEEPAFHLDELLEALIEREGSDLHLTTGVPPTVRVHGDLEPLEGFERLDATELRKMIYGILTQKQREHFENHLELDMSYSVPGRARFRVNVFQQRDALGAVMRVIPFEVKTVDELGLPSQIGDFAYTPRGFVAVTGTTGSGKSTTLASIIDVINENRAAHIMTVEDPIEFLHRHKRSVVNQREVGTDTHGFSNALKHALRQDPDVILVGEMRDLETIQIALTAAETGHLVFGTLHTADAPQTVDRIIDVFPPHQQEQIRVQLAGALQGVVSQQLLKTSDGKGRRVATEIMMATPAIRNLIREGKTHQIYSLIQSGGQHGMLAMDQSLATLVKQGAVTYEMALARCNNPQEFNRLTGRS